MKKFMVMLMVAFMLVAANVCFASTDGKDIDAQQKIVDIFISGKSYAAVKPYMAPEMLKNFSEKQYTDMFGSMQKELGNIQDKDMIVFQKIKGGDILRYVAKYEKASLMELIAVFKSENGKFQLIDFVVAPPKVNQQQNANAQKK